MRFLRRIVTACFALVLVMALPHRGSSQSAPTNAPQPSQTSPQSHKDDSQAYSLPPDKLAKAKTLNKIRLTLEIVGTLWGLAVLWLLLATRAAAGLETWAESVSRHRWVQGLIFFALFLVITTIASLPLDAIGHAASLHYGISVQGWGGWMGDQAKALGLALAIGTPVLLLFAWVVKSWPRRYWLIAWAVTIPLMVLGTTLSPYLERVFDQFEPLSKNHAALVAELERVVARTGTQIPPDRMFLMKASVKTNGLNAYVSGMGATKRVVVWDTTAGRIPDDEVLFIFGHETGHYVLHHIVKGLIITTIVLFFVYWACARAAERMVRRFGARWGIAERAGVAPLATRTGFLVLTFMVSIAGFVLQPLGNSFSRHLEHEADVYGQEAIHGIVPDPQKTAVAGFDHLGEAWLEDPNPSPFVEFWLYNHPSVQNRARFARSYDPWANGGHGKFFNQ